MVSSLSKAMMKGIISTYMTGCARTLTLNHKHASVFMKHIAPVHFN